MTTAAWLSQSSVDDIPNIFEDSDEDDDLSSSSDPDPEEDQSSPASSDETESVSSALSSPAVAPHANEPPAESDMPSPLLPGGLEESELERGEGTGRGSEDDAGLSSSADMGGAARIGADVALPASLGGVGGDVLGAGTSSRRGGGAVDAAVDAGEGQAVASLSSQTKNRTEGVVPGPRKTRVVVRVRLMLYLSVPLLSGSCEADHSLLIAGCRLPNLLRPPSLPLHRLDNICPSYLLLHPSLLIFLFFQLSALPQHLITTIPFALRLRRLNHNRP
jgi:hypothetical protein